MEEMKLPKVVGTPQDRILKFVEHFEKWSQIAEAQVKSGVLPSHITTGRQAVALMMLGWELGLGPTTVLHHTTMIQDKPGLQTYLKWALVARDFPYARKKVVKMSDKECIIEAWDAREKVSSLEQFRFTMEMAERADYPYYWKKNKTTGKMEKKRQPNWERRPEMMLYNRCLTVLINVKWPGALFGIPDLMLTEQGEAPYWVEGLVEKVADDVKVEVRANVHAEAEVIEPPVASNECVLDSEGFCRVHERTAVDHIVNTRSSDYRRIMAKCRDLGIDDDVQHGWLQENYAIGSRKEMTVGQFLRFSSWVESHELEEEPQES